MAKEYVPILCKDWITATEGLADFEKGQVIDAIMRDYGSTDGYQTILGGKAQIALDRMRFSIEEQQKFPHGMPNGRFHWNWKGGKTPKNQVERNSLESKNWRIAVFQRDHFTCQVCGKTGGKLNAHHIRPWAKYPELRYKLCNGITLCEECHKNIHRERG